MPSTSVTKIGGVVVITQVIPQDDASIPMQTPDPPVNTRAATKPSPPTAPHVTKVDSVSSAFLQGELQSLGILQIIIGVLCVLFSLTALYSELLILHAPLCLAAAFVVSGSLAVATASRTSVCLVWATLVWNIISAALGLVGVAYLCWLLSDLPMSQRFCDPSTWTEFVPDEAEVTGCQNEQWMLDVSVYGSLGLLLVLLVLQVCVAVTVCVFSGKVVRHLKRYSPILVEVNDGNNSPGQSHDVALLDDE